MHKGATAKRVAPGPVKELSDYQLGRARPYG